MAVDKFNDSFLRACRREPTERMPVWFMRQAGRSLPGYRALRRMHGVLELTRKPELAAQVSREPVDKLGVDAAILFADIMLLPIALGMKVEIVEQLGPVVGSPIKSGADVDSLAAFEGRRIDFLQETIRILRETVNVPVIGFAGAPFTLASYLIEGKPTRTWHETKRFMYSQPEAWHKLMSVLAEATVGYLRAQIQAGAQAVQLFDSWVGSLSPQDYRQNVWPYVQSILHELARDGVPRIYFGTDTAGLLGDMARLDVEVIGLDWRIELNKARALMPNKAVQGNLDPAVLLASEEVVEDRVAALLRTVDDRTGWIFNLGHGMPAEAKDTTIKHLVEYIHAQT